LCNYSFEIILRWLLVYSFDFDQHSVEATKFCWRIADEPGNWIVGKGSILDKSFIKSLGQYDIVYAWGVLHHSGSLWHAMKNAFTLVKPGGILWISIYAKGPRYNDDLAMKKKYNSSSNFVKRCMVVKRIAVIMLARIKHLQNPFTWNERRQRGMNVYNNIVDWFGGLPYEVASEDEVVKFTRKSGFILESIKVKVEGACSIYLFSFPKEPKRYNEKEQI